MWRCRRSTPSVWVCATASECWSGAENETVSATVALRDRSPAGSVFLEDCLGHDGASALSGGLVQVRKVSSSAAGDRDDQVAEQDVER